jgi:hypothetical protein
LSLIFDLRQIPYFIPYDSSSDKLSIYFIDLSRDYLEKISLGLMTSFFSAWLVKYVIDKNALRKDKKRKLLRAYRGVYSQIAIVVEAATHNFLLGGMNPADSPYLEQFRSIHYSHEMIDPVLSRRIPPHNSTDDMVKCVNDIGAKLNSRDPILTKNWQDYYKKFKQYIDGMMGHDKKEIINGSIYEIITLDNDKAVVASVYHFDAMTNKLLSGKWDHLEPEESMRRIDGYLK